MRTPLVAALVLALATIPSIDLFKSAEAQADPPRVTSTTPFAWTAPVFNEDGTPLTDLAGYVFSVAAETADLTDTSQTPLKRVQVLVANAVCAGGECRAVPKDLFADIPAGLYRVWIQAFDTAGNVSTYAAPTEVVEYDGSVPNPPTNLRPEPNPLVVLNVYGGDVDVNIGDAIALAVLNARPDPNGE